MGTIHFFYEDISFKVKNSRKLKTWISNVVTKEKSTIKEVNYIFCSDSYLLTLNQDYLNHNTYTDIITFDNAEADKNLEGDIFISIDRVKDNASGFKVSFEQELHRVMIHGVLHLLGYKDKTSSQKSLMRKKEEACLSLW
jgi:rRNA maturation RNase YbeY